MANMRLQGERWGAEFESEDVESVDFSKRPFVVQGASRTVKAHSVVIATGRSCTHIHLYIYVYHYVRSYVHVGTSRSLCISPDCL